MSNHEKDITNMMCLDIFLSSLSNDEYSQIKHKLKPPKHSFAPLLSWDIISQERFIKKHQAKRAFDQSELNIFSKKYNWTNSVNEVIDNHYQALVLTDPSLVIQWVNEGFTKMTGYPGHHVIGKTPRVLQGKNTSPETRKQIRKKLSYGKPFREVITNYRKNHEEYECELNIYPIYNNSGNISHFLALENEIS